MLSVKPYDIHSWYYQLGRKLPVTPVALVRCAYATQNACKPLLSFRFKEARGTSVHIVTCPFHICALALSHSVFRSLCVFISAFFDIQL